jgi:site-specific recombinase XerD
LILSKKPNTKPSRNPKILPKYLEKTKIDEILERARNDNKRNYLILLVLWRTGIRNSELINLKKRDIKVDELTIRQGKGHKDRIVPLDQHLSDLLQYHTAKIPLDEKVFPLTSAQIRNITHRYQSNEEVVKPHTFRHSFAVHCLKQGMNLRSLQKILGHNDLATTAGYLDVIAKDIKEDYSKVQW